jgi:hypothetical protein
VRGVGDWTIGVVGRNLFTITGYSGLDRSSARRAGRDERLGLGTHQPVDAFTPDAPLVHVQRLDALLGADRP